MIMRSYKFRLLIGLGAICVLAIATACGGGAQEDAVTKEELRSVVKEAMAESAPAPAPAPAGPSAEEMKALVSEAVAAAAPAALGPAEIGAMVEAAISALVRRRGLRRRNREVGGQGGRGSGLSRAYTPERLGDRGHRRCSDLCDSDTGADRDCRYPHRDACRPGYGYGAKSRAPSI